MKKIIAFIQKYSNASGGIIIFLFIVSGASYALILSVINTAAAYVSSGHEVLEFRLFLIFLMLLSIYLFSKKLSMRRSIEFSEEIVRSIRVNFVGKIRHAELQFLEKTSQGLLYARLTGDTTALSQTLPMIAMAIESIFSLVSVFFYLATQSLSSFFVVTGLFGLSLFVYITSYSPAKRKTKLARKKEAVFFDRLNDVLFGFKEIRINDQKSKALFEDIKTVSKETERLKTDALISLNYSFVIINLTYFSMIAGIIFILPFFDLVENSAVVRCVSALLYIWAPLSVTLKSIPNYLITNVSVENLMRLEKMIDSFNVDCLVSPPKPISDFNKIMLTSLTFKYKTKKGLSLFEMGPINFSIHKGEIVFIVGGNGSGKSTLMKLLSGLYFPDEGEISVDGKQLTHETYPSYRECFSTIFTDFHLFKKLYGLKNIDEKNVNQLLDKMQLAGKTHFKNGKFTKIDLSTGQRKRLAYVICLLENKPVYIFDEWAADQDPIFKKNFYENFLDDMRALNKTVIAVSHDDRYFDKADRVIKMEMGKIIDVWKS